MTLDEAKKDAKAVADRYGMPMYVYYNSATKVYITSTCVNLDRSYTHLRYECAEGAEYSW